MPPAFANTCQISPYEAIYKITYFGIPIGQSIAQLKINSHHHYQYSVKTTSNLFFLQHELSESSEGNWNNNAPQPLHYQYHYQNRHSKRLVNIHFHWPEHRLSNHIGNNKPWRMLVPPDTQDKLAYQLALQQDICRGKKQLTYPIADGGKLKVYHFNVIGTELLDTRLGKLTTVKVVRSPLTGKRDTTIWLAPQLHYLVVRATQANNDLLAIASVDGVRF